MSKLSNIEALADKREQFSYMRKLSEDEMSELKEKLTVTSISAKNIKEQLKEVTKEFKDQLKPIELEINSTLDLLHEKSIMVTENCFVEFDRDNNKANYYSESTGDLVHTRAMIASEMQTIIKFKTGTND